MDAKYTWELDMWGQHKQKVINQGKQRQAKDQGNERGGDNKQCWLAQNCLLYS